LSEVKSLGPDPLKVEQLILLKRHENKCASVLRSQKLMSIHDRLKAARVGLGRWIGVGSLLMGLSYGLVLPAEAADRITLQLGFLEQSIELEDLEQFAKTGRISNSLQPFSPLLTLEVRQALRQRLRLDSKTGEQSLTRLFKGTENLPFLKALDDTLPDLNQQRLQSAVSSAMRQADGLNVINVLKAYPQDTIQIDATAAISLLAKLNTSFWSTQALNPSLEQRLAATTPRRIQRSTLGDPTRPGSAIVRQETLTLRDQTRQRTIPVDLYWADRSQAPLVVLSHGLGSDRTFLSYLGQHLASYGFTVAALEHPRSNAAWFSQSPKTFQTESVFSATELVDRPQDIRFLLDELARIDRQPGALQGKLSTRQVSVIGHSLGGTTALMLAGAELDLNATQQACKKWNPVGKSPAEWLQCATISSKSKLNRQATRLRDDRVVQVMALNPVVGQLFGVEGLQKVQTPTLVLASTGDTWTPALSQQFRPFAQLPEPKYLLTAIGATHLSAGNANQVPSWAKSPFVRERQGQEVDVLRQALRGVSLALVQQLTPQARAYTSFLTPDYAQSLSTASLPLRLSTSLPPDLIERKTSESISLQELERWFRGNTFRPLSPQN
jgi:predicted dienelactone hydrolase